jgi:hypothetical protein
MSMIHLGNDSVNIGGAECFLDVVRLGDLAFGHIHEDIGDLQHIVEVLLATNGVRIIDRR